MVTEVVIYTAGGAERATVELGSGARGTFALGSEDRVTLPFTLADPVVFAIGDWCDLSGLDESLGGKFAKRYEITEPPSPAFSNTTGGWDYELRMDAYYMAWGNKLFRYLPESGAAEASWNLTADLSVHLNVLLKNLEYLGYAYNGEPYAYSIDYAHVEEKAMLVSYENTSLVDALSLMAETWECDWWVTDNVIHFGRCEDGEEVELRTGAQASSIEQSESSGEFANRIYAFGSDRNVPLTYRKRLVFTVTELDGSVFRDASRPLSPTYFDEGDTANRTVTTEFTEGGVGDIYVDVLWQGFSSTLGMLRSEKALPAGYFRFVSQTYIPAYISITRIADRKGNEDVKVNALKYNIVYSISYIGSNGEGNTLYEEEVNGTQIANLNERIAFPLPSYDLYLPVSAYVEIRADVSFTIDDTLRRWGEFYFNTTFPDAMGNYKGISLEAETDVVDYTANVRLTFLTGTLAGGTLGGWLNRQFTAEGKGWLELDGAVPSVGDTFTIDNILSSLVPSAWFTSDGDEVLANGVVSGNLRLPQGRDYVDAYRYLGGERVYIGEEGYDSADAEEMPIEEAVEAIVVKEDIYPRTESEIAAVSTREEDVPDDDGNRTGEVRTYYRITLRDFTFKSSYIISGQELGVVFTSGKMNGMDFLVSFNPDGAEEDTAEAQVFEIVASDDYGRTLPDTTLCPEAGDTVVLYGWDSSWIEGLGLVSRAEEELYDYAVEYARKAAMNDGTYTVRLYPAYVYGEGGADMPSRVFRAGQRVRLVDGALFASPRSSRVIGMEMQLDLPYDSPVYTVGESAAYSRLGDLEGRLDGVTYRGKAYYGSGSSSGGSGDGVYLIKTNDRTAASDANAYSALRSLSVFLRKDVADSTPYGLSVGGDLTVGGGTDTGSLYVRGLADLARATVAERIGSGNFLDGFFGYGWQLYQVGDDWSLTVDSLTVRKTMSIYELVVSKIRSVGGQIVVSAANGRVSDVFTVTEEADGVEVDYYVFGFKDVCEFAEGDLIRCQTFTGAYVKYYWVEVAKVEGGAVYVRVDEFGEGVCPEPGDEVVTLGNTKNPLRQNFISISATEDGQPRIEVHNGVSGKSFGLNVDEDDTLRVVLGNLDGITDSWFPDDNQPQGDGLYANNVYLKGTFLLRTGETVETRFEITEGKIASAVASGSEAAAAGNWLSNGFFADGLSKWSVSSGASTYWTHAGLWLWAGAPLVSKEGGAELTEEDGVLALELWQAGVTQLGTDMEIPAGAYMPYGSDGLPRAYALTLSFYCRCIEEGTLDVGFPDCETEGITYPTSSYRHGIRLSPTEGYERMTWTLSWDGGAPFYLHFSGRARVYGLVLTADAEEADYYQYTLIEQTQERIKLVAASVSELEEETTAKFSEVVLLSDLAYWLTGEVAKDAATASETIAASGMLTTSNFAALFSERIDAEQIAAAGLVAASALDAYATTKWVTSALAAYAKTDDVEAELALYVAKVATGEKDGDGNEIYALESNVLVRADNIQLEGYVSVNDSFAVDTDGSFKATGGNIGGFGISASELAASSGKNTMSLSATKIKFTGDGTEVCIGNNQASFIAGDAITYPMEITVSKSASGVSTNMGLCISVSGAEKDEYADLVYFSVSGNHALYIEKGDICGLRPYTRTIGSNATWLSKYDCVILASGGATIYLPDDAEVGQMYIIMCPPPSSDMVKIMSGVAKNIYDCSSGDYFTYFQIREIMTFLFRAYNGETAYWYAWSFKSV